MTCDGENLGVVLSRDTGDSVKPRLSALSCVESASNAAPDQGKSADHQGDSSASPVRREARLEGTLIVSCPGGPVEIQALFDTGSEADAVSHDKAVELRQAGVSWGDSGGNLVVANSGEIQPVGALRLLLTAEPKKVSQNAHTEGGTLRIPRSLTFCTDAEIVAGLTSELIIGYPTLVGTGLLGVVLGQEDFEPDEDKDTDELDELWPDLDQTEFVMPKLLGSSEQQQELHDLCLEFKELFGKSPYGGSELPPMDIELKKDANGDDMQPKRMACRHFAPWITELIKEDAEMRIANGWYKRGESPYASPVVAAKQPQKGPDARRICADYGEINRCAVETRYPVKNQEEVTRRLAGSSYFSTGDMLKGFHQLRLTERASKLLAVITSVGMFLPVTCPFGYHALPSHFQFLLSNTVLGDLEGKGVESFVDDICCHGRTFEEMLSNLRKVFERLRKWNLRLNGKKTILGARECVFLGHRVDGEGHSHTEDRTAAVTRMQRPYDRQQLRSFLGLTNYFRQHLLMDFAELAKPLTALTGRNVDFKWTDECQKAFDEIKKRIVNNPKLYFLDYSKDIYIRSDASKLGCGGQLFQVVDGRDRPVAYISRTFSATEQKWSTLEIELFAVVYCMKKWAPLIDGHPVTVLCDHRNVLQLAKAQAPKIVRWRLMLQQFNYRVLHVEGADAKHQVADCLSRLHGPPAKAKLSTAAVTRSHSSKASGDDAVAAHSLGLDGLIGGNAPMGHSGVKSDQRTVAPQDGGTDHPVPECMPTGESKQSEQHCGLATHESNAVADGDLRRAQGVQKQVSSAKPGKTCKQSQPQILPTPQEIEAFRTFHNDVVGHFGRDKTYQKLQTAFGNGTVKVQLSKELVAACIQRCTLCQKMEYAKGVVVRSL